MRPGQVNTKMAIRSLRRIVGTFMHDWPWFFWATCTRSKNPRSVRWIRMRNRQDRLIPGADGIGIQCDWEYTRPIHLCKVFPTTGRWLMKRALHDWPVRFSRSPDLLVAGKPDVSFVIGHRGLERLPQLLLTLESIAGQENVSFECIVVEQDSMPFVRDRLPAWVRYVYTPLSYCDMPYCRSWAFNVGVRAARGSLVILHDNDLLLPAAYAAEHVRWFQSGYEVINLKRFIFYIDQSSSALIARQSTHASPRKQSGNGAGERVRRRQYSP